MTGEQVEKQTVYEIKVRNPEEAVEAFDDIAASASKLKEELVQLKEEPLEVAPEVKLPEVEKPPKKKAPPKEAVAEQAEIQAKALKKAEVVGAYASMATKGVVRAAMSSDTGDAFKRLGLQFAETLIAELMAFLLEKAVIEGAMKLLMLQEEGLITRPTLAMVGEREPEFVVTQERMRALLSGGRPGYGFGPGDFGMTNVNVAPPNVNVEVSVAPGVDADIETAYRARAGEARLSQLEG